MYFTYRSYPKLAYRSIYRRFSCRIKHLYHTLGHEQPYKKGSSSSVWKKNKKILIPKEPFICHPLQWYHCLFHMKQSLQVNVTFPFYFTDWLPSNDQGVSWWRWQRYESCLEWCRGSRSFQVNSTSWPIRPIPEDRINVTEFKTSFVEVCCYALNWIIMLFPNPCLFPKKVGEVRVKLLFRCSFCWIIKLMLTSICAILT